MHGTRPEPFRRRASVAGMSTLDDWLVQASRALDINADAIPADLRKELLDVTRDVAHGVARIAGPLTCYLVGIAVGRGLSPTAAVAKLAALLPDEAADAVGTGSGGAASGGTASGGTASGATGAAGAASGATAAAGAASGAVDAGTDRREGPRA